ncbi:MAG: substrate-binding domain-containing protein, partial [Spirochaetaceae bacterium]|nr:substrate-binding domain-containing protein [Spirochaetaceae bacterium]
DGLIAHADEFSESAGCRALGRILTFESPDAVVATDDLLGLGALLALTDHRLDPIPCVGFNNSAQARGHVPGLSSVEIHPDELGRTAAQLLIERIEHGVARENHAIVPTRFVERASTGGSLV